ncbi:MAG: DUF4465 domain-containing protein [Thermoguttaceae bacterium]
MNRTLLNLAIVALMLAGACLPPAAATATTIGFEDAAMVTGNYENGANLSGGALMSGGAAFGNYYAYDPEYGPWWEGWACSRVTDTGNPGLANQYAAVTGGGQGASDAYGIAFQGFVMGAPTVTFSSPTRVVGAWFTNTAYTYSIITEGDPNNFARKFHQGDYYTLSVTGVRADGTATDPVNVDLADFLGASLHILNAWTWVDLSALGTVSSLQFNVDSSDKGASGINTPTYFAMDNLTVAPEPGTLWLLAVGGVFAAAGRLWRRRAGARSA